MTEQLIAFAGVAMVFGITFALMRAMWRQMRRVNAHSAAESRRAAEVVEQFSEGPPVEEWDEVQGRYVARPADVNEGLIKQGARARSSGWYLEP